jgi:hypothetical protein
MAMAMKRGLLGARKDCVAIRLKIAESAAKIQKHKTLAILLLAYQQLHHQRVDHLFGPNLIHYVSLIEDARFRLLVSRGHGVFQCQALRVPPMVLCLLKERHS